MPLVVGFTDSITPTTCEMIELLICGTSKLKTRHLLMQTWGLGDTGMFTIHAATGHSMLPELIDVVRAECQRAAAELPEAREVDRAKAQLKAGLLMSLESSGSRVEQVARQTLRYNRIVPASELVARVDAVTAADIRAFAETMIMAKPASVTIVGAGRKSAEHAQRAAAPFAAGSVAKSAPNAATHASRGVA